MPALFLERWHTPDGWRAVRLVLDVEARRWGPLEEWPVRQAAAAGVGSPGSGHGLAHLWWRPVGGRGGSSLVTPGRGVPPCEQSDVPLRRPSPGPPLTAGRSRGNDHPPRPPVLPHRGWAVPLSDPSHIAGPRRTVDESRGHCPHAPGDSRGLRGGPPPPPTSRPTRVGGPPSVTRHPHEQARQEAAV